MYCIKCGVELADSEKICPLCGLKVYHPEIPKPQNIEYPYPKFERINEKVSRFGIMMVVTLIFLLPVILSLVCDISINHTVTWSGYVTGGIVTLYVIAALPSWFRKPNPVIFVPVDFATIALFVLYIDLVNKGGWFLTFALPVIAIFGVICSTVTTLMKYLPKGALYIFGGAMIAIGGATMLIDHLINITFNTGRGIFWSIYPLIVFSFLGLILIFIAICRPLRESLKKKFFI